MAERNLNIIIKATDESTRILSRIDSSVQNTASKIESSSNRMSSAIAGVSAAWLRFGAVVASSAWLVAGVRKSYEAEVAFSKLRIQVDALGMSYKTHESIINDTISATSRYAIVQDEDVAAVLQQLVLHTGNLTQSMQNLNLVYDLAYMKGVDVATASTIVGKAMAGNIEGLGQLFPELKNVDELLGKHATTAEKAAYAQAFFSEKVANASSQMTEHELAVKRVNAAYESAHQKAGEFAIFMADKFISDLKKPGETLDWLAEKINNAAAALNPNIVVVKKNTAGLMDYEKAIQLVGSAHEKTADQIAAAAKKESDAVEAQFERIKKMTVPEGGGSLAAFILGDLDMASQQIGFAGLNLGKAFAASFAAGQAEADPLAVGDLNYNQKYITRLEDDLAYNEAYFAILDERYAKEAAYEDAILDRHITISDHNLKTQVAVEQQIMNMKFMAANQSIALLSILGQKNKAAAVAALVLSKGLMIAQVWMSTVVAAMGARAALSMIPIVGPALAEIESARIMLMGKISVGLIAATGLAELAMGGGGSSSGGVSGVGGGGGVGALPIQSPNIRGEEKGTQHITLIIQNPLNGQIADSAAEAIIDLINRGGNMNYKINAQVVAS